MAHAFLMSSNPRTQGAQRRHSWVAGLALTMALACATPICAQSEASLVFSALPVASVAVLGSTLGVAGSAALAAPVVLSAVGGVLVVKTVVSTARGTALVLESSLDGTRFSLETAGGASLAASVAVGAVVNTTAMASGTLLIASGRALAFVPNALGRALLHHERITF